MSKNSQKNENKSSEKHKIESNKAESNQNKVIFSDNNNNSFIDEKYDEIEKYVLTVDSINVAKIRKEFKIGSKRVSKIIKELRERGIIDFNTETNRYFLIATNVVQNDTFVVDEPTIEETDETTVEVNKPNIEEVDETTLEADETKLEEVDETTLEVDETIIEEAYETTLEADETIIEEVDETTLEVDETIIEETDETTLEVDEPNIEEAYETTLEEDVIDDSKIEETSEELEESLSLAEDFNTRSLKLGSLVENKAKEPIVNDNLKQEQTTSILTKDIVYWLLLIFTLIIAMVLVNHYTKVYEEKRLINQYILPIRASFSDEEKKEPIQYNDVSIISFKGYVKEKEIKNLNENKVRIIVGSSTILDDFDKQLIGLKKGESFEIEITFPENYENTDLSNKTVTFKGKINEVFELRELDNNLIKDVANAGRKAGNEQLAALTNVEELKDLIREQIEMQKHLDQVNQIEK